MTLRVRTAVLTVSGGLVACAGEPTQSGDSAEPTPVALLDPFALRPVEAMDDPLADHRPDDVDCPTAAWGAEGGGFEVQTGVCAYGAFDQSLPVEVEAGDLVEISVWHDTLDASEPADGHVAVLLDDRILWEASVAIPAPSAALDAAVILDFTPSPDARLGLHLHNHGYNSWRFVEVVVTPR